MDSHHLQSFWALRRRYELSCRAVGTWGAGWGVIAPLSYFGMNRRSKTFSFKNFGLNTVTTVISKKILVKSSENNLIFSPAFYLIIWLMTSPKIFLKIPILKIWQLVFFGGVKTYFGILPLKWGIFRHGKNWFSLIFPRTSYWSH